jgi:hypothetical protein
MKTFIEWAQLQEMRDAQEHIEFAKQRAMEYLDRGDIKNAVMSITSDLGKHPETKDHPALGMGMMIAQLNSDRDAREWISGIN